MTGGTRNKPILVASATATTGSATVRALSDMGVQVRAMVRKLDDPRAVELAKLPGVTTETGNFDDMASIKSVLKGVSRCLLVSSCFCYEQFERESLFIEAADKENLELVLRVSTASLMIKPGIKLNYGRAHHGIEAFAKVGGYPVVNLHPNSFFTNWLDHAEEAKTTGKISLPISGNGPKDLYMIDPRDIGEAAATILTLTSEELKPILAKKHIEIQGPAPLNFADKAAALSKAVGYTIEVQCVPRDTYIKVLMDTTGFARVFCTSILETLELLDGIVPPGYECYGNDGGRSGLELSSSPELTKHFTPKRTVDDWASSDAVMKAFKKD